jgi:hypothetical protein
MDSLLQEIMFQGRAITPGSAKEDTRYVNSLRSVLTPKQMTVMKGYFKQIRQGFEEDLYNPKAIKTAQKRLTARHYTMSDSTIVLMYKRWYKMEVRDKKTLFSLMKPLLSAEDFERFKKDKRTQKEFLPTQNAKGVTYDCSASVKSEFKNLHLSKQQEKTIIAYFNEEPTMFWSFSLKKGEKTLPYWEKQVKDSLFLLPILDSEQMKGYTAILAENRTKYAVDLTDFDKLNSRAGRLQKQLLELKNTIIPTALKAKIGTDTLLNDYDKMILLNFRKAYKSCSDSLNEAEYNDILRRYKTYCPNRLDAIQVSYRIDLVYPMLTEHFGCWLNQENLAMTVPIVNKCKATVLSNFKTLNDSKKILNTAFLSYFSAPKHPPTLDFFNNAMEFQDYLSVLMVLLVETP